MNADQPRFSPSHRGRGQVVDREHLAALRQLRRAFGPDQVQVAPAAPPPKRWRLLVCGSRSWTDRLLLGAALDRVALQYGNGRGVTVLHGAARGADTLAGQHAGERGWPVEAFPADWDTHGRRAGFLRNQTMLTHGRPDRVLAFAEDLATSRGTADMVGRARAAGLPVEVIEPLRYRGLSLTGSVDEMRHAVNRLRADTIGTVHDPTPQAATSLPAPDGRDTQRRLWPADREQPTVRARVARQRPGREGVERDGR